MKVIERVHYHTWFSVILTHLEQNVQVIRIQDLFRVLSQNPGHDTYEVLIVNGEWQALLTPVNNTFHYTKDIHLSCEHIIGSGAVEAVMVKEAPSFQFDSPIEQAFWDHWISCTNNSLYELVPQYPIGKYYVDFAHVPSMTAIELDGFASHSSTEDIAKDRKRQRKIESQGWHVVRFGGKEIHENSGRCVDEVYSILTRRNQEK